MKVIVVTVTYGNRFSFLKQLVDSLVHDKYVSRIVIVDNGSHNKTEIEDLKKEFPERIVILRLEKNAGSAVGFARGLEYAQKEDGSHILLLDDDNVPEADAMQIFSDTLHTLKDDAVLCGNRGNLVGSSKYFFERDDKDPLFTFFNILHLKKLKSFLSKNEVVTNHSSKAIVSVDSFAYGGTLLPIESVRKVELPDESLVLYGDDIAYSWTIKKADYKIYACASPFIRDLDLTFGQDTHITGLFDENTKPFKVFYRIRNMVYLSLKHSRQSPLVLYANMFAWFLGLLLVGAWKKGVTRTYFKRLHLIALAVYAGFFPYKPIPEGVSLP